MTIGMPMEDMLSAVVFRGDEGEVLRQASAVVGRPVVLWEIIGPRQAVARASSGPDVGARPPGFDLGAILARWSIPVPVGSRWVTTPGPTPDAWVIAPVRSRPPAPPPGGRERRSRERLALELTGLALGVIGTPTTSQQTPVLSPGMLVHQASNPLTAARAGLLLSMESIGRWVDLAADRRLALLDDLGQVLEDLDRTSGMLHAMSESARAGMMTDRGGGGDRFDVVRVVRSCLTLERRLLRDRGVDLDFTTTLESTFVKGDSNALFDLLVGIVRNAAETHTGQATPVRVELEQKGKELELVVRGGRALADLTKVRSVAEHAFNGTVKVDSPAGDITKLTIALPLPPQREADRGGRGGRG
jgi:signal transduction histidine kinase